MIPQPRRWQTEIWIGEAKEPIILYSIGLDELRSEIKAYLWKNMPLAFSNAPTHCSLPDRFKKYFYSDGSQQIPVFSLYSASETETLPEGWYLTEGVSLYPRPRRFEDFAAAIDHFANRASLLEPGPDFAEVIAEPESKFWRRLVIHPAIPAALIGAVLSLCSLAMPTSGKHQVKFLLAQGGLLGVVLFIVVVAILFALLGMLLHKGLAVFAAMKKKEPMTQE